MRQARSRGFWSTLHNGVLRPLGSLSLVAVATVLLVPSILVNWTRTQFYDSDRFADTAVAALDEEVVQDALVRAIVNEITSSGSPEVISLRPLIEFVTSTVVESLAFQEIFRNSVVELHNQTFSQGDNSEPVTLTLVDAIVVITAYLQQAYPEVAAQLPSDLDNAFIEIRNRDWAVELVAFGEDVSELAIALPAIVLLLYAAALLLAHNRRQTLLFIGVGWVAAAVLLVVARDYAREAVLGQGFVNQDISESIWDVYTQSLIGWAALLGGAGLVLSVAAPGSYRAHPLRQAEVAIRALSYSPQGAVGRVLRAVIFVVAGLIIVLQRDEALQIAVLLGAAYLVYYGLNELIWLATGGASQPVPARRGLPGRFRVASKGVLAMQAGAVVALIAATVGGFFYATRAVDTAGGQEVARPDVSACNGFPELCDRRLNELVFLGTHNSMSAASEQGWYFPHQLSSIPEQLDAGVRLLLLDTYYGYQTPNGVRTAGRDFVTEALPPDEFSPEVVEAAQRLAGIMGGVQSDDPLGTYLCHAFCELGAVPMTQSLGEINTFLEENPSEVVILFIEDHITPEDTARAFIASGLVKHVHELTPGEPMPTLRELIERDERVLVFADNLDENAGWYMQAYDYVHDTPFRVERAEDFTCELGRGSPDNPLFAMDHWLTQSFPSTVSARTVNSFSFIYNRVADCHRQRNRKVNFVIVNFFEIGEAEETVDYLNGVGPRPPVLPPAAPRP